MSLNHNYFGPSTFHLRILKSQVAYVDQFFQIKILACLINGRYYFIIERNNYHFRSGQYKPATAIWFDFESWGNFAASISHITSFVRRKRFRMFIH